MDINLNDIRLAVRTQLDLDETDLPDLLLDMYIQEGYDRIIDLEARWPFFETVWDVFCPAGTGFIGVPIDARMVESVFGPSGLLAHVDSRYFYDNFGRSTSNSSYAVAWTQVNDRLLIGPNVGTDVSYKVQGFRAPRNWIADGASGVVDADPRLHVAIVWYCCSLGYAQQEDEVLEGTYLNRFRESSDIARRSVMTPWSGSPKIFGGVSRANRSGRPSLALILPDGAVSVDGT